MASFDPYVWYVLHDAAKSVNNTLTASNNTQTAFDPDSPSAIYYAPGSGTIPSYQQWQLFPVNSSATSSSAFILRNRLIGPDAYLTTAWTTRKCGGGSCATVPVLSPTLSNSSLWDFASWGWSDVTGGAYIYNLGNDSTWRLDMMDTGTWSVPELVNTDDTGRLAQHWFVSSYAAFASSETSSFGQVPTTATALLAQFTGQGVTGSITPYSIASATSTGTASSSVSTGQAVASSAGSNTQSSSVSHSGLSTGAAIGVGVGIGAALLLIVGLLIGLFCYRKRKSRRSGTSSVSAIHTKHKHENYSVEVGGEDKKYQELESPIGDRSSMHRAEMAHPSLMSMLRPELDGRGERREAKPVMLPVEMEHPSTPR